VGGGPSTSPSPGSSTGTPTQAIPSDPLGGAGTSGGPGGTGHGGSAPIDRFVLPPVEGPGLDALIGGSVIGFGGIEWAVPAFALGVPGLLLILAVGAQALVSAAWLPMVRRWLGGFGVRRRQPAAPSGH
jgi:hypothetical protein